MQARRGTGEKLSGLSAILPILACALCPVCLSAYATILSALGVGLAITEGQHAILLGVAVVLALVSGVWRARLTRYYGPLATTAAGCALLILGDLLKENRPITFLGMGVLLVAMIWDRRATARRRAEASAGLAAA